ncbi:glycerol-3-phosphate 1-O-acyltransferase PlsY [Tengunoibacter tsumagoiensis]|uniref:Glycerol-3-phosphate acyltransferase n=1 Tax=Tengunoibacter tsumagoiensis TaxID=2014871 RepID=A0A402A4S0_9CHLR|nr:glycerol-3-phosphate 1-O-acyltransferase PlsY [Tengunoibacter tsumagoiensis]GCE14154.1 glycerol-3-phosphate acyltransferase 2 [Tengunoibacter tsumagoiensis]
MPGIILSLILIGVISYFWGSLPPGYWMGKLLRGKDFDIREHGSHKTGATNVLRTLGVGPAIVVFLLDLSKGVGPALLSRFVPAFQGGGWGILVAGLLALVGHCYPIFIGFKGGRGVLTGAGAMLVVSPLTFLIGAITTSSTIFLSRYVSLGSIVGSITTIVCGIVFYILGVNNPSLLHSIGLTLPEMLFMVIAPTMVILFHSDNIKRLLSGTERKIGSKKISTTATDPSNAL